MIAARNMLAQLAEEYPQLYLNPDTDSRDVYRDVVLKGKEPEQKSLSHYQGDPEDREEITETPAGPVRVVTLGNRKDFEIVIRNLMGAKNGPLTPVPSSQGAAMLTVFNWPRIHAYISRFPEDEQKTAFSKFTSVKENYIDMLVVLSRGPYSNVSCIEAGFDNEEWIALSDTIRRYHELTHVICRRLYPGNIANIRDELVADAVGLYAAFGRFDMRLEELFLGIREEKYIGGRLGNYTDDPEQLLKAVCAALRRIRAAADSFDGTDPFDLIPSLLEAADIGEGTAD